MHLNKNELPTFIRSSSLEDYHVTLRAVSLSLGTLGSFSIDDCNGFENVTFKMNSRFFNVCRVYSNLLKMASEGEFPWS